MSQPRIHIEHGHSPLMRHQEKTDKRFEVITRLRKTKPADLLARKDNLIEGELLLDHEEGKMHHVHALITAEGVMFYWRTKRELLSSTRKAKKDKKDKGKKGDKKDAKGKGEDKSDKKSDKKDKKGKKEEKAGAEKKEKKTNGKKKKKKGKEKKGKAGPLPKRISGFCVLYEVKVDAVGRAQTRFELITRENQDLRDVFECSSYAECAQWRSVIMHCSMTAKKEMHREAEEFWTMDEEEIDAAGFNDALTEYISTKELPAPSPEETATMFDLISSFPKTESDVHAGKITHHQLLSFCTAFGQITDSYNKLSKVAEWYIGVPQAEDLDDAFPHPVYAHSFFIYLHPLSTDSSYLKIFYTDGLLHALDVAIILEPAGKLVHLENKGDCFDSIYELIQDSRLLYYPCADHVLKKRAIKK